SQVTRRFDRVVPRALAPSSQIPRVLLGPPQRLVAGPVLSGHEVDLIALRIRSTFVLHSFSSPPTRRHHRPFWPSALPPPPSTRRQEAPPWKTQTRSRSHCLSSPRPRQQPSPHWTPSTSIARSRS